MTQGVPGRLRPRIFLTFGHYKGGRSSAKRTGRLYPRRSPWYSLSEAESISGHMVLSGEPRKKPPVTPPGIDPGIVRLVAQCLNHYTTPGPICMFIYTYKISLELHFSVEARFLHLGAFTDWNLIWNFQYDVSKMISKSVSHFVRYIFHTYFIQKIKPPPLSVYCSRTCTCRDQFIMWHNYVKTSALFPLDSIFIDRFIVQHL